MEHTLNLRIVVENPSAGVVYGLQMGSGNNYETIQKQATNGENLLFEFSVRVKVIGNKAPVFAGPFAQGPPIGRFLYIDIGTSAGQKVSPWTRRLKIPLSGVTVEMVQQLDAGPKLVLGTVVTGTGRDGGPNCVTVKPFNGWKVIKSIF